MNGQRKRIVLASASPRRQELLRDLGLDYDVLAPDVDEDRVVADSPRELAEARALLKATAAAKMMDSGITIGADTIVVVDGQVLGKPRDEEDAIRLLEALSGRTHVVITGVSVCEATSPQPQDHALDSGPSCSAHPTHSEESSRPSGHLSPRDSQAANHARCIVGAQETEVTFRRLEREEIVRYVATGEPMDKAGAYGIQGKGALLVEGIVGDYFNVVGLPLVLLASMLRQFGVRLY